MENSNLIQTVQQIAPSAIQKCIVDHANCITVIGEQIKVQQSRSGFLARLQDAVTGTAAKRQNLANQHLHTALQSTFEQINDLQSAVEISHKAMQAVNNKLTQISDALAENIEYAAETRNLLTGFKKEFQSKLDNFEMRMNAQEHLDSVISRWEAGSYDELPALAQCHVVLQELGWGEWGRHYLQLSSEKQEKQYGLIKNKCLAQIRNFIKRHGDNDRANQSYPVGFWLTCTTDGKGELLPDINRYLGNASDEHNSPYIFLASQINHNQPLSINSLPISVPRIATAERFLSPLINETLHYEY